MLRLVVTLLGVALAASTFSAASSSNNGAALAKRQTKPQVVKFEQAAQASTPVLAGIRKARGRTFRCQDQIGMERSAVQHVTPGGRAYRTWVLSLWEKRMSSACSLAEQMSDPQKAICAVFGSRCNEALRVSHCESRFSTTAQNGQYLGLFQMGYWERRTYGHGYTPYEQARAAHRYFVASGSDWSPWSCKP